MRLPWVSRAEHERQMDRWEALVREHEAGRTRADVLVLDAKDRYNDLLAKYHALKLQGFAAPPVDRVPPPTVVDPIVAAINQASAGKDPRVRVAMLAQAERDRKADLDPETIIMRIHRGNRPGEEVA